MFVVVGVAVVVSNVGVVGVRWYGVAIVCGVADVDGSVDCGIGAVGVYGIVYVHVAHTIVCVYVIFYECVSSFVVDVHAPVVGLLCVVLVVWLYWCLYMLIIDIVGVSLLRCCCYHLHP